MRKKVENISKKMTAWIGSPSSIILHTVFFVGIFVLRDFGFTTGDVLLILTTIVSLEAIYLSIFIQMTVNKHSEDLEDVSEDIEDIQENVEGISEDVEEIQKDVDELQEDVEEINEEEPEENEDHKFARIEATLQSLLEEITKIKNK